MNRILFIILIPLFLYPNQILKGQYQIHNPDLVSAIRFEKAPIIDGIVADKVWEACQPITRFIQMEPNNGEPFS